LLTERSPGQDPGPGIFDGREKIMRDPIVAAPSRYQPIASIGRGGMAEVLLAILHAGGGFTKLAVLKRVWSDLAGDPEFLAMFRDEARLAVRLNHPNVVQTYEVVEDRGQLAIAMEYLHGQPLTAVLTRLGGSREISLPLRLRILTEVLAGLQHAHELTDYSGAPLGVVHRDVSPHNVFLTYDGHVKLVDFGVAKSVAAAHETRPGSIKGKLAYMAPEQLMGGGGIDRRADIFSVGVMLWEMLAGRRLWHGMPEASIVHHLASGLPVPDLPLDFSRPSALDEICARALAVDPDQRYPTAAAFEMDLEHVMAGNEDSHARNLGRIVSHTFAAARAERETLIARYLDDDDVATTIESLGAPSPGARQPPQTPRVPSQGSFTPSRAAAVPEPSQGAFTPSRPFAAPAPSQMAFTPSRPFAPAPSHGGFTPSHPFVAPAFAGAASATPAFIAAAPEAALAPPRKRGAMRLAIAACALAVLIYLPFRLQSQSPAAQPPAAAPTARVPVPETARMAEPEAEPRERPSAALVTAWGTAEPPAPGPAAPARPAAHDDDALAERPRTAGHHHHHGEHEHRARPAGRADADDTPAAPAAADPFDADFSRRRAPARPPLDESDPFR
jgi:serine/threonine-protein kinase